MNNISKLAELVGEERVMPREFIADAAITRIKNLQRELNKQAPYSRCLSSELCKLLNVDETNVIDSVKALIHSPSTVKPPQLTTAAEILKTGIDVQESRGVERDAPDGERTMGKIISAFNILEGTELTETQGWRFMVVLKLARAVNGALNIDDYVDMASYSSLAGESAQGDK